MSLHVIIGAGPIGTALATRLENQGETVRVLTRSGAGHAAGQTERVAADAANPGVLRAQVEGAAVLYNCANPGAYQQWEKQWPPLAASILSAAEATGATLVTLSNLYVYGKVDEPMRADQPLAATGHKGKLRAQMWADALAAHEAGRVKATEVRASDFIGPTVGPSNGMLARYADKVLKGQTASIFGDPDAPHSWSYVDDVAATLALVGSDYRAHGRPWHVPTCPPVSIRETLTQIVAAAELQVKEPKLNPMPKWFFKFLTAFVPIVRELDEVVWQFERPFEIDSQETTKTFGLEPTPWDEVVNLTAASWARKR